ncbi:hypothetical protein LCGC14_2393530, partial [marine sediment metagenome]
MPSERIAELMAGRIPDRLPWVPELNAGFVRKTLGRAAPARNIATDATGEQEGGQAVAEDYPAMEAECAAKIGADHLHRTSSVAVRRQKVTIEADKATGATVVHTPAGQLRQRQQWDKVSGTVFTREHMVKGPEDFAAYAAMRQDEVYEPNYAAAEAELARSGLLTIDVPATPLMHLLMWIMDVQPTLLAMMDYRDEMVEPMAVMHEKNKEFYRLAAAGPAAV